MTAAPVDSPTAAADNAAKLAETVNSVLQPAEEPHEEVRQEETSNSENAAISGKKIISPINDLNKSPDLNELAAKEESMESSPASAPAPAPQDVPASQDTSPSQPGDKIDPNSVAL